MQNLLRIILRQIFSCHRKLRPMTQKRSAGCALARKRNMSQATALGARMCQGTFFLKKPNKCLQKNKRCGIMEP